MTSTLKYSLIAALGLMTVAPAIAQDNFPDIPENHWAYQALEEMKREGLLVGYPDGLFRGGRPASRYEMAVALHALWKRLKGITDGLEVRVKSLEDKIGTGDGDGDMKSLRDQLASMKADMDRMRGWGDEIQKLQAMAEEFRKELASMGVDVDQMKKDLSSLDERVKALEARKPAVDIHGDANLLVLGGHGNDREFGITPGGRLTGMFRGQRDGQPGAGIARDLTILHEAAFTFKGTNDEGPKWQATLVAGNMLSGNDTGAFREALGTQSTSSFLQGFGEGAGDVYFQDFKVMFDTSLAGVNFGAEIGRLGYQISPYLFKRTDYTTYFSNPRWDSGDHLFDGAVIKFNFGAAQLHVFGGRNSDRLSTNGTEISGIDRFGNGIVVPVLGGVVRAGAGSVDQSLGVRLNVPIGDMGNVNLAYLWLDSNNLSSVGFPGLATGPHDRTTVFGGDVNFKVQNVSVDGGYAAATYGQGNSNRLDDDNIAYWANAGFNVSNVAIGVGYRHVERNYGAPGSWGRIGTFWNPVNIEGFNANVRFNVSPEFSIMAKGEFVREIDDLNGGGKDKFNTFTVGLDYQLNTSWKISASYEDVTFDGVGVDPKQRWFNIGLGYNLGGNAKLDIMYQASDLKDQTGSGYTFLPANRYRGGLLSTQLSWRF
jgi:hypothetical protein